MFEPGMGTAVGMAMAQTRNRQDERQAHLDELSSKVQQLETAALRDQAFARAAAFVIDEVLAEIGQVQRGELATAARTVSMSTPAGRELRNRHYLEQAGRFMAELSNNRVRLSRQEFERLLSKLPLA